MVNAFDTNELHLQVIKMVNFMWYTFCCCCLVAKSRLTLSNPKDCNLPGSSVYGISRARKLQWWPFPSPGDLPDPGIELVSPALVGRFFTTKTLGNNVYFTTIFKKLLREKRNLPLPWSQWVMEMQSKPRQFCPKILIYVCYSRRLGHESLLGKTEDMKGKMEITKE